MYRVPAVFKHEMVHKGLNIYNLFQFWSKSEGYCSKKKMSSKMSIFKPCQNTFPPCKSDNEYSMGIVSRSSQSIKIDSNQLILSNDNGNRCKSINWNAVSNRYYRFFMILPIYNAKSDIVVFGHKLNSTAEKTHPRVTTDQQTWK